MTPDAPPDDDPNADLFAVTWRHDTDAGARRWLTIGQAIDVALDRLTKGAQRVTIILHDRPRN